MKKIIRLPALPWKPSHAHELMMANSKFSRNMECFYELKTMLKLKSIHGIDQIIMQKLQKTGIKSSSRISSNSSQTRSTKLRNCTEGVFGVSLEAMTQTDEAYIIEDHTIYLPKSVKHGCIDTST